jgi:hypothetical protein
MLFQNPAGVITGIPCPAKREFILPPVPSRSCKSPQHIIREMIHQLIDALEVFPASRGGASRGHNSATALSYRGRLIHKRVERMPL